MAVEFSNNQCNNTLAKFLNKNRMLTYNRYRSKFGIKNNLIIGYRFENISNNCFEKRTNKTSDKILVIMASLSLLRYC